MRHSEETMRTMLAALVESNSFVTLNTLSQRLVISKSSVQNYLSKAEGWLREHGLENVAIAKKQGYGIKLVLSDEERQKSTLSSAVNILPCRTEAWKAGLHHPCRARAAKGIVLSGTAGGDPSLRGNDP